MWPLPKCASRRDITLLPDLPQSLCSGSIVECPRINNKVLNVIRTCSHKEQTILSHCMWMPSISGVRSVSQGITDVTRIYPKCDEEVEKNECKDEKSDSGKVYACVTLNFHLFQIPIQLQNNHSLQT